MLDTKFWQGKIVINWHMKDINESVNFINYIMEENFEFLKVLLILLLLILKSFMEDSRPHLLYSIQQIQEFIQIMLLVINVIHSD